MPDEVSKKSLRVLDKKLQWLAEYAEFGVTINSVLGQAGPNPEDAFVRSAPAPGSLVSRAPSAFCTTTRAS